MNKLRRRIFSLVPWLLIALLLSTCALWIFDQFATPSVRLSSEGNGIFIAGQSMGIYFQNHRCATLPGQWNWRSLTLATEISLHASQNFRLDFSTARKHLLGFVFEQGDFGSGLSYPYKSVTVPYWFLILCQILSLVIWFSFRRRATQRFQAGLCLKCGYDLRASKERCPECGRVFCNS